MYRFKDIFSQSDEISLQIAININYKFINYSNFRIFVYIHSRTKRRKLASYIFYDRETKVKNAFEGGGKKDHRVSTLAHLQIRSMNEHVYVHTNDVVVAALLSITRCNRTGNKLDPLVEEHHRAFLLNIRKRKSMRRVFVAFRLTVAARYIPPPPMEKFR